MLKVVDIFYSIQGEATYSGTPSIFIRLAGCNLSCSFCDDDLHTGKYINYTHEELLEKISGFASKQVVITGGEPSLFDINAFIEFLQHRGYYVCIETNGYKFEHIKRADWITYSPKDWNALAVEGFNEYKFIVDKASQVEKFLHVDTTLPIYIQPQNFFLKPDNQNVKYCIDLVLKHPHLKLSIQMHKYLGVE